MDNESEDADFTKWVLSQVAAVNRKIPCYAGIGAHKLSGPEQLARQIQLSRELGADGFVIFNLTERLATEFLSPHALGCDFCTRLGQAIRQAAGAADWSSDREALRLSEAPPQFYILHSQFEPRYLGDYGIERICLSRIRLSGRAVSSVPESARQTTRPSGSTLTIVPCMEPRRVFTRSPG